MIKKPDNPNVSEADDNTMQFSALFDIEDLQRIQNIFSDATGVSSVITNPEGTPITTPSNFRRLCSNIIGGAVKGSTGCFKSISDKEWWYSSGAVVQPCLNPVVLQARASLTAGDKPIASWIIGQVRNENPDEGQLTRDVDESGVSKEEYSKALDELPVMSLDQFNKVAEMLFAFTKQLSEQAYQNLQLKLQVSKLEKAEEQLMEKEEKFRKLVESTSDILWETNVEGIYSYISPQIESVLGYKQHEVINRSLFDFMPLAEAENTKSILHEFIASKKSFHGLVNINLHKNGHRVVIETSGVPILDNNNNLLGYRGINRDITPWEMANAMIRESEEKYRFLFINNPQPMLIYDLETQAFMEVNEAAVNHYGYSKEEFLAMTIKDIRPVDDLPAFNENIEKIKNSANRISKARHLKKSGEIILVEISSHLLKFNGRNARHVVVNDITERVTIEDANKKAEEKLNNERLLLRTVIDNLPDSIYAKDLDSRKTLANTAEIKYLKANSEAEVLGKDDFAFYPKELAEIFYADDQSVIESGLPVINKEDYIFDDQGRKRWLLTSKLPLRDKESRIIGLVGIGNDITERMHLKEALLESEKKYRLIFEHSPLGLLSYDENGVIYACNNRFAEIMGTSVEKLVGINMLTLPDKKVVAAVQQALNGDTGYYEDMYQSINSGKITPVRAIFAPIDAMQGSVKGGTGIIEDITDRKKAEELLQKSELRYRRLFDDDLTGNFIVTRDGKFVLCNPALAKILGYDSVDELFELNIFLLTRNNNDQEKLLQLILKNKKVENFEQELVGRDGQIISVIENIIGEFNESGELIGLKGYIFDNTLRKQAEEALKLSEEKFNKAFLSSPVAMTIQNGSDLFLDVNSAFLKATGYDRDEIIGKCGSDLDLWVNKKERLRAGKLFKTHGVLRDFDFHFRKKSGSAGAGIISSESIILDGKPASLTAMMDITERKHAEQALRESEEKYRTIFDNIQDVFYQTDLEGIVLNLSPSIKHFTEFNRDEIIGKPVHALYFDPAERLSLLEEIGKHGELRDYEIILRTKSGGIKYTSVNARLINDEQGRPHHIDGALRDITERKLAEKGLQQEQFFSSSVIASLPGIFYIYTYPDLKLIRWNKNHETLLGYSTKELKNYALNKWLKPDARNLVIAAMEVVMKEGQNMIETSLFAKDGHSIPYILTGVRFEVNDEKYIMGMGIDITERKHAEEMINKAKEKAEESDRLKSAFLANMSHEIRTPMNGIIGFTELLKKPDLTGEKQQEYIRIIQNSGDRMLNIINDIMDISRIESGQMEVILTKTDINEQIDFIYDFFKPEAEQKGILLVQNKTLEAESAFIQTDKEKVYAVLTNLVKNAIKFTDKGTIQFGYNKKDNFLEYYVKDTGAGIHSSKKELIFERFRQGSELHNRNYEGAGLGLSITKAYIHMMGGEIWVESELHKGSAFYFTIPYITDVLSTETLQPEVPEESEKIQLKNAKILIAEDDETSLKLISITVEKIANQLLIARTGAEALEICRNNPDIDLILMDIQMPKMDGLEATDQIRKFLPHLPIIAITANPADITGDKIKASIFSDYVSKPFNRELLIHKIKELLK